MRKGSGIALLLITVLMASFLGFISCSNEIDGYLTGSLTISDGSRNARTISPAPEKLLVVSYRVIGFHSDGGTTFDPVTSETQPITIENLKEGTWTITVEGLNADAQTVSIRTKDVVIVSGQNTTAAFSMALPVGTGLVSITIKWPTSVTSFSKIKGTVTPAVSGKEGFEVLTSTATLDGTNNSITQTISEFPTGSYQFILEFTDDAGIVVGLPYREALNVYKDLTSSKTYAIPAVAFPVETPVVTIDSSFNVNISCATSGVTVYYTTDGTEPTLDSDVYGTSFLITKNTTVKAVAVREDRLSSAISEAFFEVPAADPLADPGAGTYDVPQTVSLTSATVGAEIYYSLGDSTPTSSSTKYETPINVSENTTIRAITVHSNYADSVVTEYVFFIKAAVPTFSLESDSYLGPQTITLSSATELAQIYYSLDESDPTSGTLYENPIEIAANTILKAVSKKTNMENSAIITKSYVILEKKVATPTFSISEGTYSTNQTVSIDCSTPEASIYYTIDGNTPTSSGSKYTDPITIDKTTTVKAIAILPDDWVDSDVASATYTLQVIAPEISLDSGTYQSAQTIELSTTTPDAAIYYTLDGADPKTSSSRIGYSGGFSIDGSLTLRAIAEKTGWLSSSESSESYEMHVADPTFSVAGGTYASAISVIIENTTPGATIYYTTDGSDPTASSTLYGKAVTVGKSMTLKAIALKAGYSNSSVSSTDYIIQGISGINIYDRINYSISIQLPEGWENGIVVSGAGGTVNVSVIPDASNKYPSYIWYLDGERMKDRIGNTVYSSSNYPYFRFGFAGNNVPLLSGPHVLAVEMTIDGILYSDQKIIVASTSGNVGMIDSTYEVGDMGPTGGYLFYENPDYETAGWRFLESAPSDVKVDYYYDHNIFGYYRQAGAAPSLVGTNTGIGTGKANTDILIQKMGEEAYKSSSLQDLATTGNYAAKLCDDFVLTKDGVVYDEWFLPSRDELWQLFVTMRFRLGGLSDGAYWSSSESSGLGAWYQPTNGSSPAPVVRSGYGRVRPVRFF